MRRVVDPASLVFLAALVGSLGVHFPVYEVLGVLADRLAAYDDEKASARASAAGAPATSEVAFDLDYDALPSPAAEPVVDTPTRPAAPPPPTPPPAAVPEEPTPPPPERRPTPEEPAATEHAVTQRSQDPTVEPPPDARFVAEENSRVEEETIARERSLDGTASQSAPAPSEEARAPGEDPGDREDELAQSEDREGADERPRPSEARAAAAATPAAPAGGQAPAGGGAPSRAGGGESSRYETITIRDGNGSFVIRRPRGSGAGNEGGIASLGPGGARRPGERGEGRGTGGRGTPNLRLGFSQLESVVGADVLAEERQAYTEQRRSRRRGPDYAESFRQFRAAIENFVPNVRTGNQTALSTRASPFAAYTAEVHRRLHMPFHEFIAGVGARGELADPNLWTKLEIVLNRDGSVHQIGVVRTSGKLLFDHGAYAAVQSGAPYPVAPDAIISGDGRIYLHWTFKAVEPFCHPIHSERYILDNGSDARTGQAAPGASGTEAGTRPSAVHLR